MLVIKPLSDSSPNISINISIDKNVYHLNEKVTGKISITVKSKTSATATVNLYQENNLIISKTHKLDLGPGSYTFSLEEALGIELIPTKESHFGPWKIEAIINSVSSIGTFFVFPRLSISISMDRNIYYLGETINGDVIVTNDESIPITIFASVSMLHNNEKIFTKEYCFPTVLPGTHTKRLEDFVDLPRNIPSDKDYLSNYKFAVYLSYESGRYFPPVAIAEDTFKVEQPKYLCTPLEGEWGEHGFKKCILESGSTVEWPILTRYNKEINKYDPFGSDPDPHGEFPYWGINSAFAEYNNYPWEITGDYSPTVEDVKKIVSYAESLGYKVNIYNDINKVIDDGSNPNVQIVNSFRTGYGESTKGNTKNGLYIIIFPPYFSKTDKCPVVCQQLAGAPPLSSFYKSLGFDSKKLIEWVIKSVQDGRKGIIITIGGAPAGEQSQAVNSESLDSFGELINFLKNKFNIDNKKIVIFGGSRGGCSSLIKAANPRGHDYNVVAVFVGAAPTAYGDHSQVKFTNFPGVKLFWPVLVGPLYWTNPSKPPTEQQINEALNSYKYSSKYPPGPTGVCWVGKVLLNTTNINTANAKSPIGYINNFRDKYIAIGINSHDSVIPVHIFLQFDIALREANIPHRTNICLGGGHAGREAWVDMEEDLENYVLNYLAKKYIPDPSTLPNGRYYYRSNPKYHTIDTVSYVGSENDGFKLPFIAIVPTILCYKIPFEGYYNKFINKQEPADVILIGEKGSTFKVHLLDENHDVIKEWTGIFTSEYYIISNIQFGCSNPPCTYYWRFWYNGEEVSPYNTPIVDHSGNPIEVQTHIWAHEPHIQEIMDFYHLGEVYVTMGVYSIPSSYLYTKEESIALGCEKAGREVLGDWYAGIKATESQKNQIVDLALIYARDYYMETE